MAEKENLADNENDLHQQEQEVTNEETRKLSKKEMRKAEKESMKNKIETLERDLLELKDKNLRLFAEFDNFRKRTSKEKMEFAKIAGQEIIKDLLPVIDDLERAQKSVNESKNIESLIEGFNLIASKLKSTLENKGLKEMNAVGEEFNSEIHEAITEIPAPTEDLKGKVVDEVEKGYYLNEKIIRYAKVVVGK